MQWGLRMGIETLSATVEKYAVFAYFWITDWHREWDRKIELCSEQCGDMYMHVIIYIFYI